MKERVKELRKKLGLTLEKFGERLGVGKNAISRIETGKSNLTDQMLKSICNVNWDGKFVNEGWLRGTSDQMFKDESNEDLETLAKKYNLTHGALIVIEKFIKMKEADRQALLDYYSEIAAALSAEDAPAVKSYSNADVGKMSIDERVELYRQELEREEKAAAKSGA